MSLTASTMLALGTKVPEFSLPDFMGRSVSIRDFDDKKALLVVFMCNHCPYVTHIKPFFSSLVREYQQKGAAVIGINANDSDSYPEDAPEYMKRDAEEYGYTFPYLIDSSQETAKAYTAACTPDFFLFDRDRKLVYRGQMDDSRPGNGKPLKGKDLKNALDAVLESSPVSEEQKPSMGCNIKWKPGKEPDYFGRL